MKLGQELDAQGPPWEQNGLPPMVNILQIALAKYQSSRRAFHQPAFLSSCLTISHICMPCLLVDELVLVFYGFSSMRSW